MLFSSLPFLYYFLPAVLLLYFAAPRRLKNTVLLAGSLVFYAWGEPRFVLVMLAEILLGYLFGRCIEKHRGTTRGRLLLILALTLDLGALGYFKYADFFLRSVNAVTGLSLPLLQITLPIGISFYTFQIISYLVDVWRGTVPAQKNLVDLAAYVAMFPQLIAGPIVRYSEIAQQLRERRHTLEDAALGARRFVLGLSKKVLIANVLYQLMTAFQSSTQRSVLFCWVYALCCVLQIYFDFSGYSDMAIGLGRICGFRFAENFDHPCVSRSVTEFWRRWHISLGSWFRDYVYIPLGGSRVSRGRQLRNILVVWLLTGLWHGAAWNFVLWGLLFALLLMAEKRFLLPVLQKRRLLSRLYMLLILPLSFVLFNAGSISEAFSQIAAMFGGGGLPLWNAETLYELRSYGVVLLMAILGATPIPARLMDRWRRSSLGNRLQTLTEAPALAALLLVNTAYLVDGSFNPFLYFRF
ncbi:MAG: MBOAT family O-acyltransferase [Clostridia bacterium]|nr:MBOAT family O-acyltransferase [Clostridia bacterium]